jgi:hypothetical protein
MQYFRVKNWDKFQHYKKDNPTWIKLYVNLFRDADWAILTDSQRGQMVMIWMLASAKQGQIPACPKMVKRLCIMDSEPDLKLFIELGFIEGSIEALEEVYTSYRPETEKRREENKTPCTKTKVLAPPSRFNEFWTNWPRKRNKKQALAIWKRKNLDQFADLLITDVQNRIAQDSQWQRGFIPHCSTYLNGHRWEDEYGSAQDSQTTQPRRR